MSEPSVRQEAAEVVAALQRCISTDHGHPTLTLHRVTGYEVADAIVGSIALIARLTEEST